MITSELKVGRPVQLLLLMMVGLFTYAFVGGTYVGLTRKPTIRSAQLDRVDRELCATLRKQGIESKVCR